MGYSYDFNNAFSDATVLTIFGGLVGLASLALRYCFTSNCNINMCFGCFHIDRTNPNPPEPPETPESKSNDSNDIISNKKNNICKV